MCGNVTVLMSGGVDSSMAAALLLERGYRVTGLTLRLAPSMSEEDDEGAIACARKVAAHLGISHRVLDLRGPFRERVLEPFNSAYSRGETPNPCVFCNRGIKFGLALESCLEEGSGRIATGHYAIARTEPDGPALFKGKSPEKDQSYFLWAIRRDYLAHVIFPLGNRTKSEVRNLAGERNLPVQHRAESQDLCFISEGSYRDIFGTGIEEGEIVDEEGRVIGKHKGIHRFTVGQRKGLQIAAPKPLYVLRVDPMENRVVVGPKESLVSRMVSTGGANFLGPLEVGERVEAKVRSRMALQEAEVTDLHESGFTIRFTEPVQAVTPGQSAVLYRGERLIAGGYIRQQ